MPSQAAQTARSDGRLRLALVLTELEPGGAERALVELATRLDRHRFDVSVFCLAGPSNAGDLPAQLAAAGISPQYLGARHWWHAPRVARQLTRALRAFGPQIVQTFLAHANVLGAWSARRAGSPRIVSGIRVAEREHTWHHGAMLLVDRWIDRHVCVSRDVAAFSEAKGLPAAKLVVIPNGIDLERIDRVAAADARTLVPIRGGEQPPKLLTFVGRLEKQKGVDWLVELAPRILARLPEHHLLIVGEGELRARLERAAQLGEAAERVHFLGWQASVPAIIKASDAVLVPSRWEGMSNVVLETMACRRPVVAMAVEGMGELLGENDPVQAAARSDDEFAAAVVELAGNSLLQSTLGEQNRARAEQFFQVRLMVARYAALYEELAGGA